ncbi:hypothetical protein IA623_04395 [Listeria seeligeri]|uniref:hypothetical protein n=1 Tax=Listeria seeligeri TaxID=1640 RepID=UPI001625A31C|nr:hypothetical protein [Listeria seeligeri]MBC1734796.1 hypothetical protein [Listeria seeligeri]MBC1738621.1 hypothetical protein [Listeria seeligeri]MBF2366292.1 hypothetical protein [Listeria seeligeri]MBF2538550.1 hypothetical protein [Listeria seeligeri]MBF2585591.1 hypothetical protein [Listeria seeligeri]
MERVKFYSPSDMSIGYHFDRLKELIKSSETMELNNLIDALEVYNILKFISEDIYPDDLSDKLIKETNSILNKKLNLFFIEISKQDILNFFRYVFANDGIDLDEKTVKNTGIDKYSDTLYREDFLECFEKYRLNEKISEDDIKGILKAYEIPIWYFLKNHFFIKYYPALIKELFLEKTINFELLLDNYTASETRYFIPTNITKDEMYKFCEKYIEYEFANLNYLCLIKQGIQGIKELNIDAKLKLKAKKRCNQIEQRMFSDENANMNKGIEQKIGVYTEKEYYDSAKEEFKNLVDIDYLKKENSKENLLEYMMYFNGFFTGNWILNLCSFPHIESSTILRTLSGVYTKKNYETSFYFNNKNILMLLSFKVYQNKLQEILDLRIEDLIVYFFSDYSKEQFLVNWLPIDFTNKSEKIHIQTKNLVTLEEQVRKQWKLYIEENEIDKELFEFEETPPLNSLGSLLDRKYIYVNDSNETSLRIMHLLFSDQSHIIHISKDLNGDNFVQLLVNNRIKKDDFHKYQRVYIDFLLDNGIISIDERGALFTTEKQLFRIHIFLNIYKYGVIHYYHCNQKPSINKVLEYQQQEIDEMIEEGLLIYKNTLFADPEVRYLNYILNDSEFDNALGLRNKYSHGSIVDENENDYFYILIVLVVYIIKINEELILNER